VVGNAVREILGDWLRRTLRRRVVVGWNGVKSGTL
jgi:hypothetical protein